MTLASAEEAAAARDALNGTEIAGRAIEVKMHDGSPRKSDPQAARLGPALESKQELSMRDQDYIRTAALITGTVTRAGKSPKTVSVTTNRRYLDEATKTHHISEESVLVHDPQNILVEGDVIKYQHFPPDLYEARAARGKKGVRFVLKEVVTPFGVPVEERVQNRQVSSPSEEENLTSRTVDLNRPDAQGAAVAAAMAT